jgi:hypothetical protein
MFSMIIASHFSHMCVCNSQVMERWTALAELPGRWDVPKTPEASWADCVQAVHLLMHMDQDTCCMESGSCPCVLGYVSFCFL